MRPFLPCEPEFARSDFPGAARNDDRLIRTVAENGSLLFYGSAVEKEFQTVITERQSHLVLRRRQEHVVGDVQEKVDRIVFPPDAFERE